MNVRTMSETRTGGKGRAAAPPPIDAEDRQGDNAACYLLFSGSQGSPRGGLGDLVQAFASEEAACQAFHQLRVKGQRHGIWAQLAVVDGAMRVKPLCWFGIGATPRRGLVFGDGTGASRSALASAAAGQRRSMPRDWRRRWRIRRDALATRRRGGAPAHGAG